MRTISYTEAMQPFFEKLTGSGAFLTTNDAKINTMTIAWASIGFYWNKPVMTVMVRDSRYTYPAIKNKQEFTVSVPTKEPLKKALGVCGSVSGRDCDKIAEAELTVTPVQHIDTPIIAECGLHFECRVLLTQPMPHRDMPGALPAELNKQWYPVKDYHDMFVGEILAAYYTD